MTGIRKVRGIDHHKKPGDYSHLRDGRVALSCPSCGHLFICPHRVVSIEPLTLDGGRQTVKAALMNEGDSIVCPNCSQRYFIRDGKVT